MSPRRVNDRLAGLAVAAFTALAVAVLGACGVPERQLDAIDREELPAALREPSTTTTSVGTDEVVVAQVLWIAGKELVPESVLFEAGPDVGRLLAVLERGPGDNDRLRSALSDEAIEEVTERDGTAVVELAEITGPDQVLAVGQLVLTLCSLPDIDQVRIVRDGDAVEVPLPDGTLVRRPLTAADYSSLLASS